MRTTVALIASLLTTLLLSACAGGLGSGDYARTQTRGVQEVQMGTVESVREVKIEGTKSGVGAVVGGVAGAATEEGATRQKGVEITVKLDGGRLIAVTQAAEPNEIFQVGERIRILSGGGVTRVTH
jgi:outer membrane lipoprotein SlyB